MSILILSLVVVVRVGLEYFHLQVSKKKNLNPIRVAAPAGDDRFVGEIKG